MWRGRLRRWPIRPGTTLPWAPSIGIRPRTPAAGARAGPHAEADGAVVRVQVQLRPDQQATFRELEVQSALGKSSSVSITREVETEARTRLGDLTPGGRAPSG